MTWHKLSDSQPNDGERVLVQLADWQASPLLPDWFDVAEYASGSWIGNWDRNVPCQPEDRWARVETPK